MRKTFVLILCGLFLLLVYACGGKVRKTHVEPVDVDITDLASIMAEYHNMDSSVRSEVRKTHYTELVAFMKVLGVDTVSDDMLLSWSESLPVTVFTPAVDSVFPSHSVVSNALSYTLGAACVEGLSIQPRRYATVVYGRPKSIYFVDSVMLIALNHFLGADYGGYSHLPAYMRNTKTPENLPYAIAEALMASDYPYRASGDESTLLSRMLYEGALSKAKMAIVENAALNKVLEYDNDDMMWIESNEATIWQQIVAAKVLYETSENIIDRFVMPSPAVNELDIILPGRIGRYIGYKIVDSYCRNNHHVGLSFLLSPEFYNKQSSFINAKYKP